MAKMNRYRASFICVLQWKGSGGIKKKLSNTWIPVSLLFSGLHAFSWCCKNQTEGTLQSSQHRFLWAAQYQKLIGRVVVVFKCNHVNITTAPPPLRIYPSKTTHKAIQMYQFTKEDLDSEEDKNSALWLQN